MNVPDPFNVCAQIKSSDLDASWGGRSFPQTRTVPWGVGCPGPKGQADLGDRAGLVPDPTVKGISQSSGSMKFLVSQYM